MVFLLVFHSFCEITLNPRPAPSDPQATPADSSFDAEMQVNQSMRQKKRKNLGQLTQMWVDGVRWSQTIVHHLSYGIFDPFFPPENAIFFFSAQLKLLAWLTWLTYG